MLLEDPYQGIINIYNCRTVIGVHKHDNYNNYFVYTGISFLQKLLALMLHNM